MRKYAFLKILTVLLKTSSKERKRKRNLKGDICFKKGKRKNLWDSIKFAYGAV